MIAHQSERVGAVKELEFVASNLEISCSQQLLCHYFVTDHYQVRYQTPKHSEF